MVIQKQKAEKRQRRKFKGHGWSKKGSKKTRRMAREKARKPRYYAVAVGWRPGIYRVWSNAAKQVSGYENNVYQSFGTLDEAQEFMRMHRHFPPSVRTPFPPAPDTPVPPQEYVYPATDELSASEDEPTPDPTPDPAVPHVAPYIQVGPPIQWQQSREGLQPTVQIKCWTVPNALV